MSDEDDPRDAAIKRHNERVARDQQAAAEQRRQRDAKARQQEQNFAAWLPAANAIGHGVNAANEDFARRGCRFVISQVPTTARGTAIFEIRPSGQLNREALFRFAMDSDGMVHIETDARGVTDQPDAVSVANVTHSWARKVADQIMIAALDGQRTFIED
jgi:hypothetical protein